VIWAFGKPEYFCKEGWTGKSLILPVRRQTAGLGCFAKPIAVIQNMMGVASAFARQATADKSLHPSCVLTMSPLGDERWSAL
jgi:hypothetical protein